MAKTYTEQALQIAERQAKIAKRDGGEANSRGVKFTASGRYFIDGTRVGFDAAVQHIAARLEAEAAPAPTPKLKGEPRRTGFNWDKLNQATQDFFFTLCEQMQTVSQDHGMTVPVSVKELQIGLVNAPRLTNAKKANLVRTIEGTKKSHKLLVLTDEGRAIWFAHRG